MNTIKIGEIPDNVCISAILYSGIGGEFHGSISHNSWMYWISFPDRSVDLTLYITKESLVGISVTELISEKNWSELEATLYKQFLGEHYKMILDAYSRAMEYFKQEGKRERSAEIKRLLS